MLTEERRQEILNWPNKGKIKLQLWIEEHEPEDKMLWKNDWWERNMLIRDRLLGKLFGYNYDIIGVHCSKSIGCPVILVKYKGIDIVLQYNFFYWQVMIKSNRPIILEDLDLYDADGNYFCYQGIPDEYQFKKYSDINNKEFAICIDDNVLDVYAFMVMLKHCIKASNRE